MLINGIYLIVLLKILVTIELVSSKGSQKSDKWVPIYPTSPLNSSSPVLLRAPNSCQVSCNHLKKAGNPTEELGKYLYLTICTLACTGKLACAKDNSCVPVMKENPDFFVQCIQKFCGNPVTMKAVFKTNGQDC